MKQRLKERRRKSKRIQRWNKLVTIVKWLLEHRIPQDLITFIIWLVDKLTPSS